MIDLHAATATITDIDAATAPTKLAQYSVGGRTVAKVAVPGGFNLTQRVVVRMPVTPTRFRVAFANRQDLTDELLTGVGAAVSMHIGPRAGTSGAFDGTPFTIFGLADPAIGSIDGSIAYSPWTDAGTFGLEAGEDYLLSTAIVMPSAAEISINPAAAYIGGNLLNGGDIAAPGALGWGGSFYDMWIEYESVGAIILGIIGHSLNSPGNVNSGVHPWDGEYQSWSNRWAEQVGAIASTMSMPGSWLGHYPDASTKWHLLDGVTPDRVAVWGASSDLAGGAGLPLAKSRIVGVVAKARSLWPAADMFVMTEPGRGLAGSVEADRLAYNTWLRGGGLGAAVTIVDTDALLSNGNVLRAAIDADGSHFTTAGHEEVARAFAIAAPLDGPLTLNVKRFQVTLDEGWMPYVQADFTCAMPTAVDRRALDLRESTLRVALNVSQRFSEPWNISDITADVGGSIAALTAAVGGAVGAVTGRYYVPLNNSVIRAGYARAFDLYMTERAFDDQAREVVIKATSDESMLLGDALLDVVPLDPATTSLRAIVNQVLARYGAALASGPYDAAVAEPDATLWQPGVGAWEYLSSLLEAASLRLWCDEHRIWRLTPREEPVDGGVSITPNDTMTGLVDRMTLDPAIWFDAVVIEYRWIDDLGANHVQYDVAGPTPAKATLRIVRSNTIYPGPGAAAGILERASGRGRVLDVRAVSDYSISPGMAATIVPVDTDAQTGYVSAVTWELPAAEMRLGTRGLVDTPPDSFFFGDDVTFADVAVSNPTLAIEDFDWSLV